MSWSLIIQERLAKLAQNCIAKTTYSAISCMKFFVRLKDVEKCLPELFNEAILAVVSVVVGNSMMIHAGLFLGTSMGTLYNHAMKVKT